MYISTLSSVHDVILLTESWLNPEIIDSEVFCSRYTVYRQDRDYFTSSKTRGGGVVIAISSIFESSLVQVEKSDVEHIFVKMKVGHICFLLVCVYIPPSSHFNVYSNHIQCVKSVANLYKDHRIIILGDYNLPNLKWHCDSLNAGNILSDIEIMLCDEFNFLDLNQYNYISNANDRILDLCFSNEYINITRCNNPLVPCDTYHPPLESLIKLKEQYLHPQNEIRFNFHKANYGALNNFLLSVNWIDLYNLNDINDIVDRFYSIIYEAVNLFVPTYTIRKSNFPLWFSPSLKKKVIEKKIAHKQYKTTGNHNHYIKFKNLRHECDLLSKVCYRNYVDNVEGQLKENSASFWRFVRDKKNNGHNIPECMLDNDQQVQGGQNIADKFANQFGSVYSGFRHTAVTNDNSTCTDCLEGVLNNIEVTFQCLLDTLLSLNVHKGAGPDLLPNIFLRECAVSICEPLSFIFNYSLRSGIFPQKWKHSYVTPIFKSGNNTDFKNYRPVCIQSAIPKVLEKIILPVMRETLKNVINERQHGFVEGRSTVTNLYVYTNFIGQAMDRGDEVHAVYTDFSKAFDLLDHDVLLEKLKRYGIDGSLHCWLSSYLRDRTLQVRFQGFYSTKFNSISGVPQGSHLGPRLFSLLVNDIGAKFNSSYLLFADDLKIFRSIKSSEDCIELQKDLDNLYDWCLINNLRLNVDKCACMRFTRKRNVTTYEYTIGGSDLRWLDQVKDLGVYLDSSLTFTSHFDIIISRANQMLGFVLRMSKDFNDLNCIVLLYTSFVRSLLEYSCVIWCPTYEVHIKRIEAVQKRLLKCIQYRASQRGLNLELSQIQDLFNLGTLENRRKIMDLTFLFKIMNNIIISPEILSTINFYVPPRDLRHFHLLSYQNSNTRHYFTMTYNRMVTLVNKHFELNFFSTSLNHFKSDIRLKLLNNL